MTMGRNRTLAAVSMASRTARPRSRNWSANSTTRMPVLRHDADEHDEADLRVDVDRGAGQEHRQHRGGEAEGHRRHDHRSRHEALELGGQNEEDHDEGDGVGQRHLARGLLQRLGLAQQDHSDVRRQEALGEPLQVLDGIAQRIADGGVGVDLDGAVLAVAVELGGYALLGDGGDAGQRHQRTRRAAHVEVHEVGRVVDGAALGLQQDGESLGRRRSGRRSRRRRSWRAASRQCRRAAGRDRRRGACRGARRAAAGSAGTEMSGLLRLGRSSSMAWANAWAGLEDALVIGADQGHLDAGGAAAAQPQ